MHLFLRRAGLTSLIAALVLALLPLDMVADSPDIVAESAFVIDANTGEVLFEKNATEQRAMASLTKLFTALVALETLPLDATMVVEPLDLVGEASMGLEAGDIVSVASLLHGLVLPSGNDAASTMARIAGNGSQQAFIEKANERVASLGLTQTHLVNPHGLDADGHYSTARDIAAFSMYALQHQPALAEAIHTPSYSGDGFTLYNTNRLLNIYPGLIGGKTGLTDAAGYCLMQVAEVDGRRVLVVLLGSTWESWYADAERLLDHGFDLLSVPGRVPSTNAITFPQAGEPVEVASFLGVDTGLMVAEQPSGSKIVSSPALANARGWSPWFWLGAVTIVSAAIVVIAIQLQKLFSLIAYGPQRRVTAASRRRPRVPASNASFPVQTQPFLLTGPLAGGSLERWPALNGIEPTRPTRERIAAAPSFAGD